MHYAWQLQSLIQRKLTIAGLAWRGNPKETGVGGICQRRVRIKTDANAYSFNALFVSMKSTQDTVNIYGKLLPQLQYFIEYL